MMLNVSRAYLGFDIYSPRWIHLSHDSHGGWVGSFFFFLMAGFSRRHKTHQPTKLLASLSGVYLWRRRRSYHHHQQQHQHKQTQQKGKKEERKQETRKAWIRANYHTNAPISRAIARNTHTLRRACVRTYVVEVFENRATGHNTILYATTYVSVVEELESRAIRNNTILYATTYVAVESPSIWKSCNWTRYVCHTLWNT